MLLVFQRSESRVSSRSATVNWHHKTQILNRARLHRRYERARDLPKLLMLWPKELQDEGLEAHQRIVAKLERALRQERQRGLAGDWTYDLARHSQLLDAWREERDRLVLAKDMYGLSAKRKARQVNPAGL
jgi:hypothetical protein